MILRGLLLAVWSTSVAWAQSEPEMRTALQIEATDTEDPWGALALADRLVREDSRRDEAVGVLMGALLDPVTEAGARIRLRTFLLGLPPRAAWSAAYRAVAEADDEALLLLADRADSRNFGTRAAALERILVRHRSDLENLDVRYAVMEGLLLSGRPNHAMAVYGEIGGAPSLVELQVIALLTRGRYDEARELDSDRVPDSCADGPLDCAHWLASQGWETATVVGLRDMISERGEWSRSRADRARLYRVLAEIEQTRGRDSAAVAAWAEAVRLDSRTTEYREHYVQALLDTGQISTARSMVRSEDEAMYRSVRAVRRISRVRPSNESESTTEVLEAALTLAPNQPIVLRAWAHHRIVMGDAEAALEVLAPLLVENPESSLTDLYGWAASESGRPDEAVRVYLAEAASTADARRWQILIDRVAAMLPLLAERAKSEAEPRRALGYYHLARSLAPDSTSTLLGLGGTWWALGELEHTLRAFETARIHGPGNRQALFSLIAVLKELEREEEAMRILSESGYADYHARLLELELQVALDARPAREALRADHWDEAIERYLSLLQTYPNNPSLMHGLADAYITAGRYEEAADAYALAQRIQPSNLWLRLGEANALVALGETVLARGVLERMIETTDPQLVQAMFRTSLAIARMEADLLAQAGRVEEAFEKYTLLLEVDPGWETLWGLGRLYQSRWQYPVAQAFFEEAASLDPGNSELEMAIVRVLMARERLEDAQHRVSSLVSTDPSPEHLELAAEVERRLRIRQAIDAGMRGQLDESERILEALLLTWEEDADGLTALSDLRARQGRHEEAWAHALAVIEEYPTHSGALAAAQRAGLVLSRADDLLSLYQAAYVEEPASWVREEIEAMELALELQHARVAFESGELDRASSLVSQAEEHYGIEEVRPWVMIGSTWLRMDVPDRAIHAFELAHTLDPEDPGAVEGLSGAWWMLGRFGTSERVLAEHWDAYGDLSTGAALARVQNDRGHRVEAQETLAAVVRAHLEGADRPVPRPPEPLPVLTLASGRVPVSAPNEVSPGPMGPPRFPVLDLGALRREVANPYRVTSYGGIGFANRPGGLGLQEMRMLTIPVAVEIVLRGPYRLNLEFVGASVENGEDRALSLSPSVAFATSEQGMFHTNVRAGLQTTATNLPSMNWSGLVRGRFEPGLSVEIETVRAPVSDSLFAWSGARDGDAGRVRDTWVGGRMSMSSENERSIGVLGRAGVSDAVRLEAVPWSQGMGWLHIPLVGQNARLWLPQIGLSLEGMFMSHDRQVGGFEAQQAGMFSPEGYRSVSGRVLGRWTTPRERFGLCTVLGAGPQQVVGSPTLYLGPGDYLGYQAEMELRLELVPGWVLAGGFKHQATQGEWFQNIGTVQIQHGRADSGLATPSPVFSSAVHGPPVIGTEACGPGWSEWGQ